MFELNVKTFNMALGMSSEEHIKFMDRATARTIADLYLQCEDVYCVEMTDILTGELLYYEMKN